MNSHAPLDPAHLLGARLKAFRLSRRMSLRALGEASGTTASFLSQLERGTSGAAISTLMKITEALSISVADLFDDRAEARHPILRKGDRQALPQSDGYRKTLLSRQPIRDFAVYVGQFDPGGSTGPDAYTHGDSHEMMLVLSGTVDLWLGPDAFRLQAGDCIEYRSSTPHRVANAGSDLAEVQWIISPVSTARSEQAQFAKRPAP